MGHHHHRHHHHSHDHHSSSKNENHHHHHGVSGLYILCALVIAAIGFIAGATTGLPGISTHELASAYENRATLAEVAEAATTHKVMHESKAEEEMLEEEEGPTGLKFEEELSLVDLRVIICITLLLILLTVAFEVMKETLEESVPEDFEIILEKFFGELTILGFLSMITFLISKTGILEKLSEHWFEGEDEELLEYVE